MAKVLLIEKDFELSMLLKLNLIKLFSVEVTEKFQVDEAIDIIDIVQDFDLIICRDEKSQSNNCQKVSNFLKEQGLTIPLLAISSDKELAYCNELLSPETTWRNVLDISGKLLGAENIKAVIDMDYISIPAIYFLNLHMDRAASDIYLRIKKGDEEFHYIKRIHQGDELEIKVVEKYIASGVSEFYILKNQFQEFVEVVSKKVSNKLKNDKLSLDEKLEVLVESFEISRERIMSLGVDDLTVEIVTESIQVMEKTLSDSKALASFLSLLKAKKASYSYAHCYLASMLLHKVVESFEWQSKAVKEKLTYVAYFHDIALKDERLMRIRSNAELEKITILEEKELVKTHANQGATIIDKFPEVPMGVSQIIREHHGIKNGSGFCDDNLSISLAPMSMMFMVVEDFVDRYLNLPLDSSKDDQLKIIHELKKVYNKSAYKQTVEALEKLISK